MYTTRHTIVLLIVSFFVVFNAIGINGANLPTLLVVETNKITNNSFVAKYSWDTSGDFYRQQISTIPNLISSSSYSQKRQMVFVFYVESNNFHIGFYGLLPTDYILRTLNPLWIIQGSIYLEDTDELWIWGTDNQTNLWFTFVKLDTCSGGACEIGEVYLYRSPTPYMFVLNQYTLSGRIMYFSTMQLCTWDFDKRQFLVKSFQVGFSPAYNMKDGLLYCQGWTKYNVQIYSINPTNQNYVRYGNTYPSFSYSVIGSLAYFIDGYYVSTISDDSNSRKYLLVFAPPGGINVNQYVDNTPMWFWELT